MYSGVLLCNERLPSVKDCKKPKSKPIDCRNMGFSNVPYDIFSIPGKILLAKNPFICDCSMVWFLREPSANKARISDLRKMRCAYPDKVNTKSVMHLREGDICRAKLVKLKDLCKRGRNGNWYCWGDVKHMPFDVFKTKKKINMYAELTCDCDVVWLIRRLKSKSNQDRFFNYEALLCKSSKKRKVMIEVTKLTENDVCPQKAADRCKVRPNPCPKTSTCEHTKTSFECVDINECLAGTRVCGENEVCRNKKNGYKCRCRKGYTREKSMCVDLCESKKNPCPNTTRCEAIELPSRTSHRCIDIDECLSGDKLCDHYEECHNKENGYECRCKQGMKRENDVCVSVIDPCKKNPPVCNEKTQQCINGKNFNFYSCEDLDECATKQHDCDENAKCINTKPGYKCLCKPGYKKYDNERNCKDIDECIVKDCGIYSQCKNTPGSYECFCKEGYQGDGIICEDINECDEMVCPTHSTCENSLGSYSCQCSPGFEWKHSACLDLDECQTNTHTCHKDALCINHVGGYKCICNNGYEDLNKGRVCFKKEKEKNSSPLGIILAVLICLLLVFLGGFGFYFHRKNKREQSDEEDLPLQKEKQAAQESLFMFNPNIYRTANAQDDLAMMLESSEEEVDFDYEVYRTIWQ